MDYVVFPFEKFVSCITTEYDVQADSILALYIEIAKYLRDNPIVSGLTVKEIIDKYLEENHPASGVISVNGKTGTVTGLYDAENPPPYPVTSVNGKTGAVTGLYDAQNPPPYPVTSVNGKTGNVVIQEGGGSSGVTSVNGKTGAVTGLYDAENPPPYPVTSVNGKTGSVTGLYSEENQPPYPVTSIFTKTGDIVSNRRSFNLFENNSNQNVLFSPFDVLYVSGAEGSLPAGNDMTRFLIFNETNVNNLGGQQFMIFGDRAGLMSNIITETKDSSGRFCLEIYLKNVSSSSVSMNYSFHLFNFSNKALTLYDCLRYKP